MPFAALWQAPVLCKGGHHTAFFLSLFKLFYFVLIRVNSCNSWMNFQKSNLLQPQYLRSRLRYWMASEIWSDLMAARPSRSAMVRATLRMRSKTRAE